MNTRPPIRIKIFSSFCSSTHAKKSLEKLDIVQKSAQITILMALKGFAMWSSFSLIKTFLNTACNPMS